MLIILGRFRRLSTWNFLFTSFAEFTSDEKQQQALFGVLAKPSMMINTIAIKLSHSRIAAMRQIYSMEQKKVFRERNYFNSHTVGLGRIGDTNMIVGSFTLSPASMWLL